MTEGPVVNHDFFRVDLRTHHLSCLDMATPEDGIDQRPTWSPKEIPFYDGRTLVVEYS